VGKSVENLKLSRTGLVVTMQRNLLPLLAMGAVVLFVAVLARFGITGTHRLFFSVLHVLLVACVLAGLYNASKRAVLGDENAGSMSYWIVILIALLAIVMAQIIDVTMDLVGPVANLPLPDNMPSLILVAVSAFLVGAAPFVARGSYLLMSGLLALASFGLINAIPESFGGNALSSTGISPWVVAATTQLIGLFCLGCFVFVSYARANFRIGTWEGTKLLDTRDEALDGSFVGSRSRQMFLNGGIPLSPRHPPASIAFRPGFQDVTFFLVLLGMLAWAAGPVKKGTGKGYFKQARDMTRLWFMHRIDPPTYYAMDLYRPENANWFPHLLTRFETKNGLFSTLNRHRVNPRAGHEMNDKRLFAEVCAEFSIPHPQPLMIIDENGVAPQASMENMERDLFCKPRKTMGAKDTLAFTWLGEGSYLDGKGHKLDIFGVCAAVALKKKPMLVQPWLRNHEDVSGFAKDSLVAIRVVTVLNEKDDPEVTLAMTRLLSKLEPDWQHLPDGEYAAPINLETGEMGLFTGDNFKTSLVRMTHHPVTGIAIKGRVLKNWPAVRDLALKAHRAFKHRVIVGWDIALTPDGPMMLEGNTNLDVMFLQRVHNCPAGDTRFGELLNYQIQQLYVAKQAA
jgi:Sugar-transfer associated ATP-grasp